MLLNELFYYAGSPFECGGTSIQGNVSPAIKLLSGSGEIGIIKPDMTVLDYGAGKYARNADYLRKNDIKTFAFDPFNFNATSSEGWDKGKIADTVALRNNDGKKFDIAFTCFVLNVVPKKIEENIIKKVGKLGKKLVHVTRNLDVFIMVKNALKKKDRFVYTFFVKEFNNGKELDLEKLTDKKIMEFCKFGVQTSRGFQRIPDLEEYGYDLASETSGWKIYIK